MNWNKLNPIFWFGNIDDPKPLDWYLSGKPNWWRVFRWYLRNPLHNFTHYVIGFADKRHLVHCGEVWNPDGGLNIIPPFISYKGEKYEFYFGWRGYRGGFGITFRKKT